jgi:hypothetical protein
MLMASGITFSKNKNEITVVTDHNNTSLKMAYKHIHLIGLR